MELSEQQLQALIRREVNQAIEATIRHWCFTCQHFKFRKNGTRVCQCPDDQYEGKTVGGDCVNWALEPDPARRVKRMA